MSFKEQVEQDIHSVFLNLDEFGELGEIAGHPDTPMVVETLDLGFPEAASDDRPGVSYEWVTVHVAELDVPDRLLPGRKTTFRNEEWYVSEAATVDGMRTIRLYRETA